MSTSQPTVLRRLRANLDAVRDRLARAASSAGRSAEEVRLLPVTKSVSPEAVLGELQGALGRHLFVWVELVSVEPVERIGLLSVEPSDAEEEGGDRDRQSETRC